MLGDNEDGSDLASVAQPLTQPLTQPLVQHLTSAWANALAHELRNHAMPALLRLDVLDATPGLPAASREDLAVIRRSVEQMQRLATGMLDEHRLATTHDGEDVEGTTPPVNRFTVMCVDDSALLVEALERRLSLETGFVAFYRSAEITAAVTEAERLLPTIILLDVNLPGGVDALSMLSMFVQRVPTAHVIMFTGMPTNDLVTRAMYLGARGFISKGVPADRLMTAIHRIVAGDIVVELDQ